MAASVSNTVLGIITDAMMDAGLLQEGSDPNSEQLANNMRRLCDLVNLWQTQGCKLFLLEEMTIDLVADTSSYTLAAPTVTPPSKHLRVIQGRIETSDGVKRPITPVSWSEWNQLSQTSSGAVTHYFVDKKATSLVIKVWNTPDSTEAGNSLILLVQKQITNPINLTEEMTFPQEWRIALRWGLADDICSGQPQAIMDRCAERAQVYRGMLEDFDVEDTSTRFEADMQGYGGGSFT